MQKRRFQRGFHRFGPGVAEDRLARARVPALKGHPAQGFTQIGFHSGRMHVAHGVQQLASLFQQGFAHDRRGMAQSAYGKGGGEIKEAVSVHIPDIRAHGAFPENREIVR